MSAFAVLLTGEHVSAGAIPVNPGEDRGVHIGDVFVLTGWALALLAVARLLAAGRHRDG